MSALTEPDTVNEFELIFNTNVCTHDSDTVKEFELIFNTNVCTHWTRHS